MGVTRVILHVDRLVLRGVGALNRDAVAEWLTRELQAQLARPHVADRLASRPDAVRLHVGRVRVDATTPTTLGRVVARRIARKVTS